MVSPLSSIPRQRAKGKLHSFVAHFVTAGVEPHHVLDLATRESAGLGKISGGEKPDAGAGAESASW